MIATITNDGKASCALPCASACIYACLYVCVCVPGCIFMCKCTVLSTYQSFNVPTVTQLLFSVYSIVHLSKLCRDCSLCRVARWWQRLDDGSFLELSEMSSAVHLLFRITSNKVTTSFLAISISCQLFTWTGGERDFILNSQMQLNLPLR